MSPPLRRSVDSPPLPTSHRQTRPSPGRGLMRAEHPAPGRGLMPTPVPAKCLRRLGCSSPSPSPPSPSSSSGGSHSSPSRDSRPTCCGSGHSPASLVACRSDVSWHLHSAPPSAPCRRRRVQHSAHPVSCACRGGRLVPRYEEAADVTAEPRDGRTPSGGAPERLLQLTRPASAPKRPVSPTDQLVHQDAAGSWPPAGQRQPAAPAASLQQRQRRLACRHPCQPACRLVLVGPRGFWRQAGVRQHRPPLPRPVHLRRACRLPQQSLLFSPSAPQKLRRQCILALPSWHPSGLRRQSCLLSPFLPP